MKKYLMVLIISVMVLSCFFGKTLIMASGEESEPVYDRYYTNIEIQKGDSLWSIAKKYNKNSGMEIREYIDEIRQINGLTNDRIANGDSLTIIYFAESPLEQ